MSEFKLEAITLKEEFDPFAEFIELDHLEADEQPKISDEPVNPMTIITEI